MDNAPAVSDGGRGAVFTSDQRTPSEDYGQFRPTDAPEDDPEPAYPTPTLHEFLDYLYDYLPEGRHYFELTLIAPPGLLPDRPRIMSRGYEIGKDEPDWPKVGRLNQEGYGVYYGVTPKRARPAPNRRSKEADASVCQALWVDLDLADGYYPTKHDALYALQSFFPMPNFIIDSGGGMHGLWRIDPVIVDAESTPLLKRTLRGLALALHGDPAVAELARVLRLPGSINTKPERQHAPCYVVDWILGYGTTLRDFADFAALAEPERPLLKRLFTRHKPAELPKYVQWYLDTAHPAGDRNNALNWTAYKMHSDGYSEGDATAILLPHATNGGLSEKEALRTIRSAFDAEPGVPGYVDKRLATRMRAGAAVGGEAVQK